MLYPFFAAVLGWLGVALTGSDTSSNVLFGSLQKITAQQLGLDPVLITAANSTGGVMGKMIDAQSIVVATAATNQPGQEGQILRFVFWHSIALVCIMGIIVMLQAYVFPWMVPKWPVGSRVSRPGSDPGSGIGIRGSHGWGRSLLLSREHGCEAEAGSCLSHLLPHRQRGDAADDHQVAHRDQREALKAHSAARPYQVEDV